jgi:hypothetical protein
MALSQEIENNTNVPAHSVRTSSFGPPADAPEAGPYADDVGFFGGKAKEFAGVPAHSVKSTSFAPEMNIASAPAETASSFTSPKESPAAKALDSMANADDKSFTEVAGTPVGTAAYATTNMPGYSPAAEPAAPAASSLPARRRPSDEARAVCTDPSREYFNPFSLKGPLMGVPSFDLCLRQGNNGAWEFRFKSYDDDGNLLPFDLTGSTLAFRAEKSDGTYLSKTLTPDDPETGKVTLSLTATESRDFTIGRFNRWEIERRIDSNEYTLIQGFVNVTEGVNDDA